MGTDWASIASFATAGGTLVLGVATFVSVRSANRMARTAERALQVNERALQINLRPLLVPSRTEDTSQKIRWADDHWARLAGSAATVEFVDGNIYLAISLRNVGSGIAVIHGWWASIDPLVVASGHAGLEQFRMQTRDLYLPTGDASFWQGVIRDSSDPDYAGLTKVIKDSQPFTIELLYGDHEGGQRTITGFGIIPRQDGEEVRWIPSAGRHWNLDRPDPR